MSGLDIYDHFECVGDGTTTYFDFGVPVQQIAGVKLAAKDEPGASMDIVKWKQLPRGVHILYTLSEGETVTAYYYRA